MIINKHQKQKLYRLNKNNKFVVSLAVSFNLIIFLAAIHPSNVGNLGTVVLGYFVSPAYADSLNPRDYQYWKLPDVAPSPDRNKLNMAKAELGKKLFFDPRLSGDGKMSCATCHDPNLGWADGKATATGHNGKILPRATPTIYNVGFNNILMWDGRASSLEDQALSPINNPDEMHNTTENVIRTLKSIPAYQKEFKKVFWGLSINATTISKSIASFQRLVVANKSRFDRWLNGDLSALTEKEMLGFQVFIDSDKANCARCHRAPNFTDDGFHNIGLKSFGAKNKDLGRHMVVPVNLTRGAFKTPPLRNIALTAPYFHDGSAKNLEEVVAHYKTGGVDKSNISPNMRKLTINRKETEALIAFLSSLTSDVDPALSEVALPK